MSREGKHVTCRKCGQVGHNQRSCKGQRGPASQTGGSQSKIGSKPVKKKDGGASVGGSSKPLKKKDDGASVGGSSKPPKKKPSKKNSGASGAMPTSVGSQPANHGSQPASQTSAIIVGSQGAGASAARFGSPNRFTKTSANRFSPLKQS